MATEAVQSDPKTNTGLLSTVHPLAPLSAEEIRRASQLLRGVWPANTDIYFKAITLEEPPKTSVLSLLQAEQEGYRPSSIPRRAFIAYYLKGTVCQ